MSTGFWVMRQNWKDVLFLHYPIDAEELQPLLPKGLELDLFDGQAWIGLVLFKAEGTRLRFLPPIPWTASFLEVNVRTYVKYEGRSGVYFFSLDANSALAVKVASTGSFLPYRHAEMKASKRGHRHIFQSETRHTGSPVEALKLSYQVESDVISRRPFEKWLTERYCLWTQPNKRLLRLNIQHSPWELHYVKGELSRNTMAAFLDETLHEQEPVAHYSSYKQVQFYKPVPEI